MKKAHLIAVIILLMCLLAVTFKVQASQSTNYRIDWFTPLTSGGGGAASSAHYSTNVTIGQTASQVSASTSYAAGLGYWYGVIIEYLTHMPVIIK